MSVPFKDYPLGIGYRLDERLHSVCTVASHRFGNVSVLVKRERRRVVSEVLLYCLYVIP